MCKHSYDILEGEEKLTLWNGEEKASLEAETDEVSGVVFDRAHGALSLAWASLTVEVGEVHILIYEIHLREKQRGGGGSPSLSYHHLQGRTIHFIQ